MLSQYLRTKTYYFRVPNIDVAVKTIKANGGQITVEPTEIPGGEFQINALDPQGAAFALVGPRENDGWQIYNEAETANKWQALDSLAGQPR